MNIRKVNRFFEFIRVAGLVDFILGVEQIAFAISFVDGAENPAVTVKIRKLRLLEL